MSDPSARLKPTCFQELILTHPQVLIFVNDLAEARIKVSDHLQPT